VGDRQKVIFFVYGSLSVGVMQRYLSERSETVGSNPAVCTHTTCSPITLMALRTIICLINANHSMSPAPHLLSFFVDKWGNTHNQIMDEIVGWYENRGGHERTTELFLRHYSSTSRRRIHFFFFASHRSEIIIGSRIITQVSNEMR